MRHIGRSTAIALTTIGAATLLAFTSIFTSMVTLAATALYMGGTGHPLSIPEDTTEFITSFIDGANSNYVAVSGLCTGGNPGCVPVAVYTPQRFKFDTGLTDMTFDESAAVGRANLDACLGGDFCTVTDPPYTATGMQKLTDTSYVVYGYSQSAAIASIEKSWLIAHPPAGTVSFVLTSNPNRPNGGILERFVGIYLPIVGVTFNGARPPTRRSPPLSLLSTWPGNTIPQRTSRPIR